MRGNQYELLTLQIQLKPYWSRSSLCLWYLLSVDMIAISGHDPGSVNLSSGSLSVFRLHLCFNDTFFFF